MYTLVQKVSHRVFVIISSNAWPIFNIFFTGTLCSNEVIVTTSQTLRYTEFAPVSADHASVSWLTEIDQCILLV